MSLKKLIKKFPDSFSEDLPDQEEILAALQKLGLIKNYAINGGSVSVYFTASDVRNPQVSPSEYALANIKTTLCEEVIKRNPAVFMEPEPEEEPERKVSKAALKLAEENGIDLSEIEGTGDNGNVTVSDVRSFIGTSE